MRLIIYILILCLTVWAGFFLYGNPAIVQLSYNDWIIEMPIWLPVLSGIAAIFIITLIYNLFSSIVKTYRRVRDWLIGSSLKNQIRNIDEAYTSFVEGDWAPAEAKLIKCAKKSEFPLHCYLDAAKAAQQQGALERRDDYLHQALLISPHTKVATFLTQAELQYEQGQYEYCLVTLQELKKLVPSNRILLKLMANVYAVTGAWDDMLELLPQLDKYHVLPLEDLTALEIKTYTYIMRAEAKKSGQPGLTARWEDLPRNVRNHVELVENYAQLLLSMQAYNEVELLIRNYSKRQWDQKLVKLYGLALSNDIPKQISTAETWLRTHSENPVLLLTLARLCIANKLWGKAKSYLEAVLAIESNPDAYAELGRLLGFLGEQQKALESYKKGLMEYAEVLPIEQPNK